MTVKDDRATRGMNSTSASYFEKRNRGRQRVVLLHSTHLSTDLTVTDPPARVPTGGFSPVAGILNGGNRRR